MTATQPNVERFDAIVVGGGPAGSTAARRLALSQSALDDLMADARSLRQTLSSHDQKTLDEYLQSVRDTEIKVEKAKRWMNIPLPTVDGDHLKRVLGGWGEADDLAAQLVG